MKIVEKLENPERENWKKELKENYKLSKNLPNKGTQ